jgi:predicted O-methyltransferase YrrM
MEERNVKILVETGTARYGLKNCSGDGCSTALFADWAKDHDATLFSVDIDPEAISESSEAIESINNKVQFFTQDSITFLKNFGQSIDFLYLDSYDFDYQNPRPSQIHHLNEIKAVMPFLHKNTIIMIDDCDLPHGGKGKLVIRYLISQGWEISMSEYQTILLYPSK